jgi:hypothetical protein
MLSKWFGSRGIENRSRAGRGNTSRPVLEGLESRLLLYSTLGANWAYGSRITYSFVPDGTDVAGFSSNLYSTLNAKFATATWQAQFQKAAAAWEGAANINLVQVSDNGADMGTGLYQQGDPGMGDIRISMANLPSGELGFTLSPPPINGCSDAGDIVLNSNINWQINSNYDLLTVALHEFGHALGMDHSTDTTADMYAAYTGLKQSLSADDVAGIQSIYGAPQGDRLETGAYGNNYYQTATNLTPYLNSDGQTTQSNLSISGPFDQDWFYVTVPSNTTGSMKITMQSSGLSSLSPALGIYTSSLNGFVSVQAPNVYGATLTVTVTGVAPGQGYYIRALPASNPGSAGMYGLMVNFGSQPQIPLSRPNPQVLAQTNSRGGSSSQMIGSDSLSTGQRSVRNGLDFSDVVRSSIGDIFGMGAMFAASSRTSLTPGSSNQTLTVSVSSPSAPFAAGLSPLITTNFSTAFADLQSAMSSKFDPVQALPLPPQAMSSLVLQALDNALTLWRSSDRWSLLGDG